MGHENEKRLDKPASRTSINAASCKRKFLFFIRHQEVDHGIKQFNV